MGNKVRMRAVDAIVHFLEAKGVDQLYGVPGAGILPFYDAIKNSEKITSYVVRHEQMGAFMADGYSRVTGKVGVCAATSGPGATNLLTGLYGAIADSVPMLAFTGQVPAGQIGTDAFQEAPIVAMAEPVTKKSFQPKTAAVVPAMIREAWKVATTGRKGPVLIDLPLDVQKGEVEVDLDELTADIIEELPQPADEVVKLALEMISNAKSPVIIAGGGVVLAEAAQELKKFAEMLALPVVATLMGKDCFPNDHVLFAGHMGTICQTPLGNHTVLNADLLLCLGGRFGDRSTGKVDVLTAGRKIIHVNLDQREINRNVPADLGIAADLKAFLEKAIRIAKVLGLAQKDFIDCAHVQQLQKERIALARESDFNTVPIKPQQAIAELSKFLERDAIVTHDCGISQIWSAQFFEAYEPRTYLVTGRAGTMGWGLGAAMAAKLAKPKRQAVNLLGDGSLGMSLQDLGTAAKFNIPVVIFILNNSLLGLIRQQQNLNFNRRWISTDLDYHNEVCGHERGIDFVQVAKGFGLGAELLERVEEIRPALERAFAFNRPYLIEVLVDPLAVCSVSKDGTISGVVETE